MLIRSFDEPIVKYDGKLEKAALQEWVDTTSTPSYAILDQCAPSPAPQRPASHSPHSEVFQGADSEVAFCAQRAGLLPWAPRPVADPRPWAASAAEGSPAFRRPEP